MTFEEKMEKTVKDLGYVAPELMLERVWQKANQMEMTEEDMQFVKECPHHVAFIAARLLSSLVHEKWKTGAL